MRTLESCFCCIFRYKFACSESIINTLAVSFATITTCMIGSSDESSSMLLLRAVVLDMAILCRAPWWQSNNILSIDHALSQNINLSFRSVSRLPFPIIVNLLLPIFFLPRSHQTRVFINATLQMLYASSQLFLLSPIFLLHPPHFFLQLSDLCCSSFSERSLRLPVLCLSLRRWCVNRGLSAWLRFRR